MATSQQAPDPIDSRESLEPSVIDAELKPVSVENLNEQPPAKDEKLKYNVSHDSSAMDHSTSRDAPGQLVSLHARGDISAAYPASMYGPQAQMYHFGGYENLTGEWEEYTQHFNVEGSEIGSAGVYGENPSLVYHTGYGYSPHMPYGPYYPVTMPLPSISGDGQLYPHRFPFSSPHYQQPAPPSMPYQSSSAPISQADCTPPIDQGAFIADTANINSMPFGPRPGYHVSHGSFGGGSLDGNSGTLGFYDLHQGFDGFSSGGFWSDWWKSPDGTGSVTPLPSPAASPQPLQRSLYGFGSSVISYDRWYPHSGFYHGSTFGGSFSSLGNNGWSLLAVDKSTKRGKANASLGSSNDTLDILSEQNRGPRANRSKNQATQQNSVTDNDNVSSTAGVDHKLYNSPDFVTEYKNARFFIIKSYSEDNVHKSIKYGVWASTSNGNRKLNSAYIEAKEKGHPCPIFLFFSVNASAHFCGVAEMVGPVDFDKSVDYWQQAKWSGQFPVKWHIVKDIPNTMFRHIILENNDNKPVTNSRDTQEVKLEQGQEMLSIFKKHEYEASILDDSEFYEERENALKERKARQQQPPTDSTRATPVALGDMQRNPVVISSDSMNQISKNFAQVVRLEEKSSLDLSTD